MEEENRCDDLKTDILSFLLSHILEIDITRFQKKTCFILTTKSQNTSDENFKKISIVFYFIDDSLNTSRREILMKNNLGKVSHFRTSMY